MIRFSYWRLGSALVLIGALGVLVPGCARPIGTVSGKITFEGKPLKGGTIGFQSTEERESFATSINEDGSYAITNLKGGSYKVTVDTSNLKPPSSGPVVSSGPKTNPSGAKKDEVGKDKGKPPADAPIPEGYKASGPAGAKLAENAKRYVQIPSKYAKAETTDFSFTFKGGTETFDIELK